MAHPIAELRRQARNGFLHFQYCGSNAYSLCSSKMFKMHLTCGLSLIPLFFTASTPPAVYAQSTTPVNIEAGPQGIDSWAGQYIKNSRPAQAALEMIVPEFVSSAKSADDDSSRHGVSLWVGLWSSNSTVAWRVGLTFIVQSNGKLECVPWTHLYPNSPTLLPSLGNETATFSCEVGDTIGIAAQAFPLIDELAGYVYKAGDPNLGAGVNVTRLENPLLQEITAFMVSSKVERLRQVESSNFENIADSKLGHSERRSITPS